MTDTTAFGLAFEADAVITKATPTQTETKEQE
jgi:hypothetical protein